MSAARKLQNGSVIVVVASVILLISSLLAGVTLVQQNQNINEEAASCYDRCRKEKGKGRKYCNNECGTEYNFAGVDTKVYEPAEPKQQTTTVATEEDLAREKSECLTDGNVWRNNTCSTQTQTQKPDLNDLTQDEIDFITDTKEKLKDDEITPISPTDNNIQNIPEKLKDDEITPAITTTNTTKKKIGENCTTNTDCDSNNCQSVPGAKLCVEKGVNTEQIAQSYKQAQDSKKTNLYLGETCSVNYQCLSDYCNNGICAKKPTELLEAERQKQLELFTTGNESGSGEKTTETAKKPTVIDNFVTEFKESFGEGSIFENSTPNLAGGAENFALSVAPQSVLFSDDPEALKKFNNESLISAGLGFTSAVSVLTPAAVIPTVARIGPQATVLYLLGAPAAPLVEDVLDTTDLIVTQNLCSQGVFDACNAVGTALINNQYGTPNIIAGKIDDAFRSVKNLFTPSNPRTITNLADNADDAVKLLSDSPPQGVIDMVLDDTGVYVPQIIPKGKIADDFFSVIFPSQTQITATIDIPKISNQFNDLKDRALNVFPNGIILNNSESSAGLTIKLTESGGAALFDNFGTVNLPSSARVEEILKPIENSAADLLLDFSPPQYNPDLPGYIVPKQLEPVAELSEYLFQPYKPLDYEYYKNPIQDNSIPPPKWYQDLANTITGNTGGTPTVITLADDGKFYDELGNLYIEPQSLPQQIAKLWDDYIAKPVGDFVDDINSVLRLEIDVPPKTIKQLEDIPITKSISERWTTENSTESNLDDLYNKVNKLKNRKFDPSKITVLDTQNIAGREILEIKLPTNDKLLIYRSTGQDSPGFKQEGDWVVINGFSGGGTDPSGVSFFIKSPYSTQLTKGYNAYLTDLANFLKTTGPDGLPTGSILPPSTFSKVVDSVVANLTPTRLAFGAGTTGIAVIAVDIAFDFSDLGIRDQIIETGQNLWSSFLNLIPPENERGTTESKELGKRNEEAKKESDFGELVNENLTESQPIPDDCVNREILDTAVVGGNTGLRYNSSFEPDVVVVNDRIKGAEFSQFTDTWMVEEAVKPVQEWTTWINEQGYSPFISSAYRSYETQEAYSRSYEDEAATPGASCHQSGLCFDVHYYVDNKTGKRYDLCYDPNKPECKINLDAQVKAQELGIAHPYEWDQPHYFVAVAASPAILPFVQQQSTRVTYIDQLNEELLKLQDKCTQYTLP